jgi:hypothetical protein
MTYQKLIRVSNALCIVGMLIMLVAVVLYGGDDFWRRPPSDPDIPNPTDPGALRVPIFKEKSSC